ncbi:sugar transferase [Dermatobacter hominis]|uniref:sugar transferase n=1 Tax=Dermatobacter hominis TaxID=2884263 RepID=UPI001D117AB2|nr:sugar transferase [Dermatobacter hominis]UDY35426.1 sugar transferase [Dermatobacter hominis]
MAARTGTTRVAIINSETNPPEDATADLRRAVSGGRATVTELPARTAARPVPAGHERGPVLSHLSLRMVLLKAGVVAADVVTILAAYTITTLVVGSWAGWTTSEVDDHLRIAALTLPVWPILFARQQMYAARFLTRLMDELRRVVHVVVVGTVALVLVGWLAGTELAHGWVAAFLVVALACVTLERFLVRRWFVHRRRSGRSLRDVVIIGTNAEALDLALALENPALGYRLVGYVSTDPTATGSIDGLPVLAGTADTVAFAHSLDAQGVILATTSLEVGLSNRLLRGLLDGGLHVEMTSGLRDVTPERMTVRPLGRHPVVYLEPARRFGWRAVAKRIFDTALSTVALVLTAPLLLVAAIAIKVTSPGPVLFRQVRVGRDGEPFFVLKLRTMVVDAEERLAELLEQNESDGPLFKMRHDPRITRVGRVLRKLSIDELPQLWNVVRGDMSLIGPRPALPREVAEWGQELHERLRVRPGITGMWQVSGRSDSGFEEYQRLDLFYVDNWSILIDLGILIRTVPAVLTARGAS